MQSIFMVCLLWELPGQASLEATPPGERATGEMVGQKDATGWLQRLLEPTPTSSWLGDHGIVLRGFTNGNFTAASKTGNNLPMGMNYLGNQFQLEQNTLIVEKPIDTDSDSFHWGFRTYSILPGTDYRFTVANNLMTGQLSANNGQPNTYGVDIPEFWVQAWLPELRTDIKAGRFFTILCNESVDPTNNRLVSRALTFMNNPFTSAGLLATTRLSDNWTWTNGITSGNDVFFGPASGPMYLGGLRYDSDDRHTAWAFNTTLGDNTYDMRLMQGRTFDVFELYLSRDLVSVSDRLNYTLDMMYSLENGIDGAFNMPDGSYPRYYQGNASWYGFINYLTYTFNEELAATFRFEVFDDPFGVRTGFQGVYTTYTLGSVWKVRDGLWLRPEVRLDNNANSMAYNGSHSLFTAAADFIIRW